ncbi:MAG: glutamate synthase-related protein [Legionellales bacterium]|nr:glutamate synthase-related protein [Legionellales bacterium]
MPYKLSSLAASVKNRMFSEARDRSACGVSVMVRLPTVVNGEIIRPKPTHAMVQQGLEVLGNFEYRTGYNPVHKIHDGAGIRISLSTRFYSEKVKQGEFISPIGESLSNVTLKEGGFGIGQYFLPKNARDILQEQSLIEQCAKAEGLSVLGWRNLEHAIHPEVLSNTARDNIPGMRQALFKPISDEVALEHALEKVAFRIITESKQTDIVSQSSQSIVYKGTIPTQLLGAFYGDLKNPLQETIFALLHGRFSTNTATLWPNVQPCPYYWAHNGELNSAPRNFRELQQQLAAHGLQVPASTRTQSDSIQFDLDLFLQRQMQGASLYETFVRLMPPPSSPKYSAEVRAMLNYFRRLRTPHNGPAFGVAIADNHIIAKLDEGGLRPAHICINEDAFGVRELHAASDSYLLAPPGGKIIQKGHLASGDMLLVTPEGDILNTHQILSKISARYHQVSPDYFQRRQKETTLPLTTHVLQPLVAPIPHDKLQRKLFASGWDSEAVTQCLRPMAESGEELVAAMGNDTNPLFSKEMPSHMSHFMGEEWVQVSAPSRDYLREVLEFVMSTWIGPIPQAVSPKAKQIELETPILQPEVFHAIEHHETLKSCVIHICFPAPSAGELSSTMAREMLQRALQQVLNDVRLAVQGKEINCLILSDRHISQDKASIPDVLAIAAVRQYLEVNHLTREVSILVDTLQAVSPHQLATLLALGAQAVYPRGSYEKLKSLYEESAPLKLANYCSALKKGLLKSMGILGLTDVNNYINGRFLSVLGLDFQVDPKAPPDELSLGNIFSGMSSPLGGYHLGDIALDLFKRHADAYDPMHDFTRLPRSGFFMPEHGGVKHGFGPEVVNATASWMQAEDVLAKSFQLDQMLARQGIPGFVSDHSRFTPSAGFLDPREKNYGTPVGLYPVTYLERFKPSKEFLKMSRTLDEYKRAHPTSLRDYLAFKKPSSPVTPSTDLESQLSIRKKVCTGGMSRGALTVSPEDNPDQLGAHETLTAGMNAVHSKSGSGEGGQRSQDMDDPLKTSGISQAASGRFAFSAEQLRAGIYNEYGELGLELEIKVGQGAKPGQGGKLPAEKVTVSFAALRGGLAGVEQTSPPNQYTLQSIEEFDEFRHAILRVDPCITLCVKIVSKEGIGSVAIGLAKLGVSTINIAGNSGGTGAAEQGSLKFAGSPSEFGLAEADRALRMAGLRELVTLCVSGGIKTADDILLLAALGAQRFEFGSYALMLLGCRMLRTCNKSCQPGVTMDGHLFKGQQINVERFIVNLAAEIQMKLKDMGIPSLEALRGRTDLLEVISPEINARYQFSAILDRSGLPDKPSAELLQGARDHWALALIHPKEDALVQKIKTFFHANPSGVYVSEPLDLNIQDRSFGASVAGTFVKHLKAHPEAQIILNTTGIGGQSFAFVMPERMAIHHTGSVQDGCGQSLSGELVLKTPFAPDYKAHEHILVGNIALYGARGKAYINGRAANRFCPVGQGVEAVVEGTLDRACQMNLSSTVLIAGPTGENLCAGASGGIVFVYTKGSPLNPSDSVRMAPTKERLPYMTAIENMLRDHVKKTGSEIGTTLLSEGLNPDDFQVVIPKTLDKIKTFQGIVDIIKTYQLRKVPLTAGMQVWFDQKVISLLAKQPPCSSHELDQLRLVLAPAKSRVLSPSVHEQLSTFQKSGSQRTLAQKIAAKPVPKITQVQPVEVRLSHVTGILDVILRHALTEITDYVEKLSHDAEGCSGCRSQSCAGGEGVNTGCPSGKAVHTINNRLKRIGPVIDGRLTPKQWSALRQAFDVQVEASPFIAYTGAACPAPCQDACTEGMEAVHIKDIEYWLFQVGRALGWFDGSKIWKDEEVALIFGDPAGLRAYEDAIRRFKPPFRSFPIKTDKELIIVGSGPAAMQLAFHALKEGVHVRMYEASDKPGGLLANGIPAHKFDKIYLDEDFDRLKAMGLELHLNSEVSFDGLLYKARGVTIASTENEHQSIALCVGAGSPKELPHAVTESLPSAARHKIIQASDFLAIANDLAILFKKHPGITEAEREETITSRFGHMDPRGKKIVVIGGGDTAQDVVRWLARYFNQARGEDSGLDLLIRGYQPSTRAVMDGFPHPSRALTSENKLRMEELEYVQGKANQLIEAQKITVMPNGKLSLELKEGRFKYHEEINSLSLKAIQLYADLPRDMRPLDPKRTVTRHLEEIDLIICALGFQGKESIPLMRAIQSVSPPRTYDAGDVTGTEAQIIVGAQAGATKTWRGQMRGDMSLGSKPISAWAGLRLFQAVDSRPPELGKGVVSTGVSMPSM